MTTSGDAARSLADRFWDGLLETEPLIGTVVGDERFDDRLPSPDEAGRARRHELHSGALESLRRIDREGLDVVWRTTLDVLEAIARRALDTLSLRLDRFEAVTHLWGPGQLLAEMGSLQRADTPDRYERYFARLRAVPKYLAAVEEVMQEAVGVGQTVPGLVVDRAIAQTERLLATPPASSPAMTPVVAGSAEEREGVTELLRATVLPAYEGYLGALRRYRPFATKTLGRSALPNGEEMYAADVEGWTGLALDPKEVHELGRRELAKIEEERVASAQRLGYPDPDAAIAALDASGRNVAPSREALVQLALGQVERGWEAAPGFFGVLPQANCEVRAVEEFREADMPFAFYQSPNADNSRPGIYYVNAYDLPQRPLHHLATTTYHEANPGHHFQISLEQERGDRPPLRRFGGLLAGSAFAEGWGLYSERLADEMGLFVDEYERLGMLDAQAMRAARLVVDTGIHAFEWSRDRAVEQLRVVGVPQLDAEVEVDRYIALPGQALAYKIGQLEIEKWRAVAEAREGSSFRLPAFHDTLLSLGSLPLPALGRELTGP